MSRAQRTQQYHAKLVLDCATVDGKRLAVERLLDPLADILRLQNDFDLALPVCESILPQLLSFTRHKDWDVRLAAAHGFALFVIEILTAIAARKQSSPADTTSQPTFSQFSRCIHASAQTSLGFLVYDDLNISDLMERGKPLLASDDAPTADVTTNATSSVPTAPEPAAADTVKRATRRRARSNARTSAAPLCDDTAVEGPNTTASATIASSETTAPTIETTAPTSETKAASSNGMIIANSIAASTRLAQQRAHVRAILGRETTVDDAGPNPSLVRNTIAANLNVDEDGITDADLLSASMPMLPTSAADAISVRAAVKAKLRVHNTSNEDGESCIDRLCAFLQKCYFDMLYELFASDWESRHGAACCIHELFTRLSCTTKDNPAECGCDVIAADKACLLDVAVRATAILLLDKVGDYSAREVHAPVRNMAALLLGDVCERAFDVNMLQTLMLHIQRLLASPDWHVRHGGSEALRCMLISARKSNTTQFDTIELQCFEHAQRCLRTEVHVDVMASLLQLFACLAECVEATRLSLFVDCLVSSECGQMPRCHVQTGLMKLLCVVLQRCTALAFPVFQKLFDLCLPDVREGIPCDVLPLYGVVIARLPVVFDDNYVKKPVSAGQKRSRSDVACLSWWHNSAPPRLIVSICHLCCFMGSAGSSDPAYCELNAAIAALFHALQTHAVGVGSTKLLSWPFLQELLNVCCLGDNEVTPASVMSYIPKKLDAMAEHCASAWECVPDDVSSAAFAIPTISPQSRRLLIDLLASVLAAGTTAEWAVASVHKWLMDVVEGAVSAAVLMGSTAVIRRFHELIPHVKIPSLTKRMADMLTRQLQEWHGMDPYENERAVALQEIKTLSTPLFVTTQQLLDYCGIKVDAEVMLNPSYLRGNAVQAIDAATGHKNADVSLLRSKLSKQLSEWEHNADLIHRRIVASFAQTVLDLTDNVSSLPMNAVIQGLVEHIIFEYTAVYRDASVHGICRIIQSVQQRTQLAVLTSLVERAGATEVAAANVFDLFSSLPKEILHHCLESCHLDSLLWLVGASILATADASAASAASAATLIDVRVVIAQWFNHWNTTENESMLQRILQKLAENGTILLPLLSHLYEHAIQPLFQAQNGADAVIIAQKQQTLTAMKIMLKSCASHPEQVHLCALVMIPFVLQHFQDADEGLRDSAGDLLRVLSPTLPACMAQIPVISAALTSSALTEAIKSGRECILALVSGVSTGLRHIPASLSRRFAFPTHSPTIHIDVSSVTDMVAASGCTSTLRPYQQIGVYWLNFLQQHNLHGILADEMGLGKSLQVLASIAIYATNHSSKDAVKASLIVCPSSIVGHWVQEARKHFNPDVFTVVKGISRDSKTPVAGHTLHVITFTEARLHYKQLCDKQWAFLVLDEAHSIRNPSSALTAAMISISGSALHRIALTGTPIHNDISDFWSIFRFIMPHFLPSYAEFVETVRNPVKKANHVNATEVDIRKAEMLLEQLHRKTLPFVLRRLKSEVLQDLPPMQITEVPCVMLDTQNNAYNRVFASKEVTGLQKIHQLRLICAHSDVSALSSGEDVAEFVRKSAKLTALGNLLYQYKLTDTALSDDATQDPSERPHKALVFVHARDVQDLVQHVIAGLGCASVYVLSSLQNNAIRTKAVSDFKEDPDPSVMVCTTTVGGLGLDLSAASVVIFFDLSWNPMVDLQAMHRAHRIGQTRQLQVFQLYCVGTVEERILEQQKQKLRVVDAVIASSDEHTEPTDFDALISQPSRPGSEHNAAEGEVVDDELLPPSIIETLLKW